MLSRENRTLIFLRTHAAGIEDEPQIRCVCGLLHLGENDVCWRSIILVFDRARAPPSVPREPEVLSRCGNAVHLSRRLIVSHAINLIVVGPERLVLWIEVHADWIAQPDCINFSILTVAVHANNAAHPYFAVQIELLLRRHIIRLAELDSACCPVRSGNRARRDWNFL